MWKIYNSLKLLLLNFNINGFKNQDLYYDFFDGLFDFLLLTPESTRIGGATVNVGVPNIILDV